MDNALIGRWNARVKPGDTVFHIGDYLFNGSEARLKYYRSMLNGTIVFIQGNHDRNNRVKALIKNCVIEYAGVDILLVHNPGTLHDLCNTSEVSLVLCGHVHTAWKTRYHVVVQEERPLRSIPVVNVGVDQWDFYPVSIREIEKVVRIISHKEA